MRRSVIMQLQKIFSSRLRLPFLMFGALSAGAFGQTLTTLYDFGASSTDAVAPGSGVIFDKAGNLYGVTGFGGFQGANGTVFKLTPPASGQGAWTETIFHRFRGSPDGKIPQSRPIMTAQGVLLGTTLRGGATDQGTIYAFTPATGGTFKEKILHDFGTVTGDVVSSNLGLFSASEGFYGADQGGANNTGAFYLLSRAAGSNTYTQNILYTFGTFDSSDGSGPGGELVRDAKGNFYGVTVQGGVNNLGTVYQLSPPVVTGNPWTETILFSFNGTNGSLPEERLLLGAGGVLYGTTDGGGVSDAGTVFQLTPPAAPDGAWTETVLYAFTGGNDGGFPGGGVIRDAKGNLLGNAGNSVFKLTPQAGGTWTESVLHNFTGPDGFIATGPLTLSKNAVYGTTSEGGAHGVGTAFKLTLQ